MFFEDLLHIHKELKEKDYSQLESLKLLKTLSKEHLCLSRLE